MSISLGLRAVLEHDVGDADSALSMRSGDVPVLATPRLIALCEEATVEALRPEMRADVTSVGTRIEFEHLGVLAVGRRVSVRAELVHLDGRLLRFDVVAHEAAPEGAHDGPDRLVGHGHITRVLIDRDRFMARVSQQEDGAESG